MSLPSDSRTYAQRVVQVVVYGKPVSAKFPMLNEAPARSRGSGFFVRLQGESVPRYILTAAHVVEDAFVEGGTKVILPLFGQKELPVRVVALLPEIDLAVLELDTTGKERYVDAFPLGNDHDLVFGSDVPLLVLGYPLGQDQLKVLRCNFSGRQDIGIQTDCAMNKGNSGGPIVFRNHIMGWVSAGVHPALSNNVSWAVPINQFTAMLPLVRKALASGNTVPQVLHVPHAGIMYHNSSMATATEECQGVVIQFVSQQSVLKDVARPGDKLCSVEFGGHRYKLDARGDVQVPWYFAKLPFSQISAEIPAGEPVTFHIWDATTHQFKSHRAPLTFPNQGGFLFQSLRYEPLDYETFGGLLIMPFRGNHLTDFPHLRTSLKPAEREQEWLLVTHVVPGSEAYEMGVINPGDLLAQVNGLPVHTLADLRQALLRPTVHPSHTQQRTVTFETTDHASLTLDLRTLLRHEVTYSQQTGSKPSVLVQQLSLSEQQSDQPAQ